MRARDVSGHSHDMERKRLKNSSIGRLEVKLHLMKEPFVSDQQMIRDKEEMCYLIDEM